MAETEAFYELKDMQPSIDFIKEGIEKVEEEKYKEDLQKIIDNVKVAIDSAADNAEKHAYLYALYVNNAVALACYLFRNNALTPEMEKTFRTLPTEKDAQNAIQPYADRNEATRVGIMEQQQEFMKHNKGMEVFKGIALGDSPEQAKAGVAAHDAQQAEAQAVMANR